MSLVQSLRALLKSNLVPTLITDASLCPTGFNAAAKEFLPGLTKGVPLPEQFPAMMWLSVPARLSLMRPATILLDGSAHGRFAMHLVPVFHESGLQGTVCSISDSTSISLDPAIATAMHDLSTPLMTLRNCLSLLSGHVSEQGKPLLDVMEQNVAALRRNVSALATTLDADITVSASTAVNLCDAVTAVTGQLAPGLADEGAPKLVCSLKDSPIVFANGLSLERALLNLISNALQHCKSTVTVSALCEEGFGVLRVADDGPGIAVQDMPHILRPWFTTGSPGSGLGLCMVDQFARLSGGRLDVENRDGAVFTLRLPLPDKLNLSAVRPDETHLSPALIHYELALTLARRAGKNAPDFSLF